MDCECPCENDNSDGAFPGWWQNTNNVQMGLFTVVGYLLYRFSQTLPVLIRWPIRLFCSLTGLTALWGWVGHLVGTLKGIQSLCKWLSRVWRFIKGCSSKLKWLGAAITGSSDVDPTGSRPSQPGLRLILLGPAGGGRTSLANHLLGNNDTHTQANAHTGPVMESTLTKAVIDGREVTLIDTPDLLGSSMEKSAKAREALRSLQLASPGPHALLLVIRAPGSSMGMDQDAAQAIRATLELFGDGALQHILPVLTHADRMGGRHTVDQLLDVDAGGLKRALVLCEQRPELVDNRPDCPPEEQSVKCRQLLGRVFEMETLRGHLVHELQRREERRMEELLDDMACELSTKLGHM